MDFRKGLIAFDNTLEGFSLHNLATGQPIRLYPTGTPKRTYPRQVCFAENGRALVGGSDHGKIYVFDRKTGSPIDVLSHGDERELTSTVTVCPIKSKSS